MIRGDDHQPPSLFDAVGKASTAHPAALAAARRTPPAHPAEVRFAVLSSSSSGNASVVVVGSGDNYRLILIDAGLSPRKTQSLLQSIGLDSERIDHLVLTHLHRDHIHNTWVRALRKNVTTWLPEPHLKWAGRMGLTRTRTEVVVPDGATEHTITRGITLRAIMAPHDAMGSALLRIDIPTPDAPASLGYATDLGAIPEHAPEFLAGVDILALESNYDPHLQQSSGRHPMLVDRVMGGAGHLSNDESAQLARAVEPKDQLILLHLSRQCNTPHLAESAHAHGVACPVTPAAHDRVTGPYTLVGASVPASTAQTTS